MFFGEKLVELRQLNGYSRKELATRIGVTEQAIWQYETAVTIPKIVTLNRLRDIFNVETKYFFSASFLVNAASQAGVAYRRADRDSRKKTKFELVYLNFIDYFISHFESLLTTATPSITSLKRIVRKMLLTPQANSDVPALIAQCASYARSYLKVTTNDTIMTKLELSGIYILEKHLGPAIDAYSVENKFHRNYIVLGRYQKTAVRRNFDLVHELGHLLLHQGVDMETLSISEHQRIEHEADLFAADFLLPAAEFIADFQALSRCSNPDHYLALKAKYCTSIAVLALHGYQLGLMSYQEYRYFNAAMVRKGYQQFEPLDDKLVPVKPGRLVALLSVGLDNKVTSLPNLEATFQITPQFLTTIFGLDQHLFDQYTVSDHRGRATVRHANFASK